MFESIKNLIKSHISLARVETTAVTAALSDRDHRILAEARKKNKRRKAKKKAKREGRKFVATIASLTPWFGLIGAVIGRSIGNGEGQAIGERVGINAAEVVAKKAEEDRLAVEEARCEERKQKRDAEERTRGEKRIKALRFLIRAMLESSPKTSLEVLKECDMEGSVAEIESALNAVGVAEDGASGTKVWRPKIKQEIDEDRDLESVA